MNETDAAAAASAYGEEHLPALGPRTWRTTEFEGGWLATPTGDDLRWRTGLPCLVVLTDGSIHLESSSLPPPMLISKYTTSVGEHETDGPAEQQKPDRPSTVDPG